MYPPIPRDINGDPIPVVWDDIAKVWRVVRGTEHGQRVGLLGPDGQPISTGNPLPVKGEVQLSGSKTRVSSPPVTGVKTVTGVAAELFAGASRKAGRSRLVLRNMHSSLRLRIGPPTVTDSTGFGVEPQAVVEIDIDPASDVPWYAISEAGAIQVEVLEA